MTCFPVDAILVRTKHRHVCAVALILCGLASTAAGQNSLLLVNDETQVRGVDFRFPETRTFDTAQLRDQIATTGPKSRFRWAFWRSPKYPFEPFELQRDVVRLERFYSRNGFLFPEINYRASQFDSTRNSIRVILSIVEGPPLIIQDVAYVGPDGDYAVNQFQSGLRDEWTNFSEKNSVRIGDRFTEFQRIDIQSKVLGWLNDYGFAFARVGATTTIDSTYNTVDVQFDVDAGPLTVINQIDIEGAGAIPPRVIRRELPFTTGDVFSKADLVRGQEELFGLNLFRLVLSDVPEQPRDSTVTVRYRVQESKLRQLNSQVSYSLTDGLGGQVDWQHRNFFGGARQFGISTEAASGYPVTTAGNNLPPRRIRGSISINQPYFFSRKLSAGLSPFILYERDLHLQQSDRLLGFNRRDLGANATLVYQLLSYRAVSFQYSFQRTLAFTRPSDNVTTLVRDVYSRSVVSLGGTFGRTNNFLDPRRGFLVRPFIEHAGGYFGSAVEYVKVGGEITVYHQLPRHVDLIARMFSGRVWPYGLSEDALSGIASSEDSLQFENRFDPILFEAGGAADVRGWPDRLLGPKIPKYIFNASGDTIRVAYEPVGGRAKWSGGIIARYPFPLLGSNWGIATFIDAGIVSSTVMRSPDGTFVARDRGRLRDGSIRIGTGAGIRYRTPFGFLRLDLAMKINPSRDDLRRPEEALLGIDRRRFIRRFRVHIGFGQTF